MVNGILLQHDQNMDDKLSYDEFKNFAKEVYTMILSAPQ